MSDTWDHLVSLALLGTERQPFTLPNIDGHVGKVISSK